MMLPIPPFFLLYTAALIDRQQHDKNFRLSWWHKLIWALYLRISVFQWLCDTLVVLALLIANGHYQWERRGTPVQSQEH
jgi:hypothetical protein